MDTTTVVFTSIFMILLVLLVIAVLKRKKLEGLVVVRDREVVAANEEILRVRHESEVAVAEIQKVVDQQLSDVSNESERTRQHYEAEALKLKIESDHALAKALKQLESLQRYQGLLNAEGEAHRLLTEALLEATSLRAEATTLMDLAREAAVDVNSQASQRAKEIQRNADTVLDHATREAGRLVEEAHRKAQEIGGDAYTALRDNERLERAVIAIRNVINGYGDRYLMHKSSVLDDLAAEFGHTQGGKALAAARDQTKRMTEEGHAASCDYADENRRETAIRFVIDAFNGRVDAILSRIETRQPRTLSQRYRDAFALSIRMARFFRNARILSAYL